MAASAAPVAAGVHGDDSDDVDVLLDALAHAIRQPQRAEVA
jgi:hypothetical protein